LFFHLVKVLRVKNFNKNMEVQMAEPVKTGLKPVTIFKEIDL